MGFWWGHMQKYHDSPPCKRYLLSCWGKTKKGFKLLSPSNNLKWMLLYLCKKLWPVLSPFYLCAHAPSMPLSPTWWHHVCPRSSSRLCGDWVIWSQKCAKEYNSNCKPTCWATQYKMRENHSIQYKLRGNHSICAKGMSTIRYAFTIFESWIKGHWTNIRTTCYVNIIVCKSHFRESKWISSCEFRNNRPKRPLFAQFWLVLALFRIFCKRQKFSEKNGARCGLKN